MDYREEEIRTLEDNSRALDFERECENEDIGLGKYEAETYNRGNGFVTVVCKECDGQGCPECRFAGKLSVYYKDIETTNEGE